MTEYKARRVVLRISVLLTMTLAVLLPLRPAVATIVVTGDISPGPPGTQSDPWNAGLLAIGISAPGSLLIDNGSRVNSTTAYLALGGDSTASLTMHGESTLWNNTGPLNIGDDGTATVSIEEGATIESAGTTIVGKTSPNNYVTITSLSGDFTSTMRIGGDLYLGGGPTGPAGGTATIDIGTGGQLEIFGGTYVYHGSTIDPGPGGLISSGVQLLGGNITGTQPTSVLNLNHSGTVSGWGSLNINTYLGTGGLIAGDPASDLYFNGNLTGTGTIQGVTVGGSIGIGEPLTNLLGDPLTVDRIVGSIIFHDVTVSPNTIFDFGIHGDTINDFDQLVITGPDRIDGVANIAFIEGFLPDVADTFQLITMGSQSNATGWFSEVIAPPNWQLDPTGLLYHTPEPGAALLALLGCMLLCCRRLKRPLRASRL
jgi:T5SS/PEP-CTERM-associated repeat protein